MALIVVVLVFLALMFLPAWWVKRVIARYQKPPDRYGVTGAQTAQRLLKALDLAHVKVETTDAGDHYDPQDKVIRLLPEHHDGRSLAAVVIAAHETGHALQDRDRMPLFLWRGHLAQFAMVLQRIAPIALFGAPLLGLLTRSPALGALLMGIAVLSVAGATLVHLVTLPVELDASFKRALPLLDEQDVLHDVDRPHAVKLLRAAALTYVAASLVSLVNIWRWLRLLR